MKTHLLTAFVCLSTWAGAQDIQVTETTDIFSTGSQKALSTTVYQSDANAVGKAWKNYLKDLKAEKVSDSKKEQFADNVLIPQLGNTTVDVYTKFTEDPTKKTVIMVVAYDLGGAYMNAKDHPDKVTAAKKLMHDFAFKLSKASYEDYLGDENKALQKLQNQQKDLEKDKANLQKLIANNTDKITKAEADIKTTEADLAKKEEEIKAQEKVVSASANAVSEQAEASKKIHKKLLDQRDDLQSKLAGLKKDIINYNNKIDKAKEDIVKNDADQEQKKQAIAQQTTKVNGIKEQSASLK